jgi:hypothetical protein
MFVKPGLGHFEQDLLGQISRLRNREELKTITRTASAVRNIDLNFDKNKE